MNDVKAKDQYEDCVTTTLLIVQNLWSMRNDALIMDNQYRDLINMLTDVAYALSEIMTNQMK